MWDVKKRFFLALTRVRFCLVAYFPCIFLARCTYKKYLSKSRRSFSIIWNIIRHVPMIIWQKQVIFVDFKNMTFRSSKNPMSGANKAFFQSDWNNDVSLTITPVSIKFTYQNFCILTTFIQSIIYHCLLWFKLFFNNDSNVSYSKGDRKVNHFYPHTDIWKISKIILWGG